MIRADVMAWVAGLLQLCVACYALRLNRLFGAARVGWSLFSAFGLLAVFHLIQSIQPEVLGSEVRLREDVIYVLISLLLLTAMVHIETMWKARIRTEQRERRLRVEMDRQFQEKTESLTRANEELRLTASQLEAEIAERKRMAAQVENTFKELLTTSRQAGMTEVATNVLHNVGNVLNSVNVSASVVAEHLGQLRAGSVVRLAALLNQHSGDLAGFIARDPRGQQLPAFLAELGRHLIDEQASLLKEIGFVKKKVEHIKSIVAMQQDYARVSGIAETVKVSDLVEDALQMNADALVRHDVEIFREFDPRVPEITVEKHKVLQVLVNLIRNAKYACDDSGRKNKHLTVRVNNGEGRVRIAVIDNGVGIPPENLTKIFNHGFTTRKGGHGFGLHGGAIAAKDMGGTLTAQSEGLGKGATFTLELPPHPKQTPK